MKDLQDIRIELDEIDRQILALYERRLALAEDVVRGKASVSDCLFILKRKLDRLFADVRGDALSMNGPGAAPPKEDGPHERT